MRTATLDRILAALVIVMTGTGLLALKSGSLGAAWVFTIHGLVGGALLLATLLKARRSLPPGSLGLVARSWHRREHCDLDQAHLMTRRCPEARLELSTSGGN